MQPKLIFEKNGVKVLQAGDEFTLFDVEHLPPSHELGYRYGQRIWSQNLAQRAFDNIKGTGQTIRLNGAELKAQFKTKENA
jgi:hypothetical protein